VELFQVPINLSSRPDFSVDFSWGKDAIYLGWMLIDTAQWLEMDQNKSDFRKNQLEFPNMLSPSMQNSKQVDNSAGIRLSHKRVTSAAHLFCRKISHPEFAMRPMG